MIPDKKQIEDLHKRYATTDKHFSKCYTHCQIVEEIALWCVDNAKLTVDKDILSASCLLHDVGSYMFLDENGVMNAPYYQLHAMLGSKILEEEGVDILICDAIQTHLMMGVTKQDIVALGKKAMPDKDYIPQTLEAELVCYADRFHSKLPVFNSYDSLVKNLGQVSGNQVKKFKSSADRFGIPDIDTLSKKYGQPIK